MTKLNYTRRNGHKKYKIKQIKQILPNILVDNMLGQYVASVFTAALQANTGENLLYQMLQRTLDHVCYLFVHLYPLKVIQVFLETKEELLKLIRKKQFFVLLVLKPFSGRFIDRHIHNTFITSRQTTDWTILRPNQLDGAFWKRILSGWFGVILELKSLSK